MERFWSKVNIGDTDECWEWTGYRLKGHGRFGLNGKTEYAHRVSWQMEKGTIPDGMCVLHKCNNRPCVNPNHLYIGDYRDNAIDRSIDGTNPKMKMGAGDVRLLRELADIGTHYKALSWLFEISESAVHRITSRKTYGWVD